MRPVPEAVYDAALRLASGGTDPDDLAAVDEWYVRNEPVANLIGLPDFEAEARKILLLATERGVARVCRD